MHYNVCLLAENCTSKSVLEYYVLSWYLKVNKLYKFIDIQFLFRYRLLTLHFDEDCSSCWNVSNL